MAQEIKIEIDFNLDLTIYCDEVFEAEIFLQDYSSGAVVREVKGWEQVEQNIRLVCDCLNKLIISSPEDLFMFGFMALILVLTAVGSVVFHI